MTPNQDHSLEGSLASTIAAPAQERLAALRQRLAARAAREGLLDVAYASVDSPIGELLVAATPRGLVQVTFASEAREEALDQLAARVSPRVLEAPDRLDEPRRQLDEYFTGRRTAFEIALDWSLVRGFHRDVLLATARIPYAHTETYRSVATAAGSAGAVRSAGTALARNPLPIVVPCHRVVRSDGTLGDYRGGVERKQLLLDLEASRP
jgi:methylated-DNA-[protein]-cysteine S-methyltransferase